MTPCLKSFLIISLSSGYFSCWKIMGGLVDLASFVQLQLLCCWVAVFRRGKPRLFRMVFPNRSFLHLLGQLAGERSAFW